MIDIKVTRPHGTYWCADVKTPDGENSVSATGVSPKAAIDSAVSLLGWMASPNGNQATVADIAPDPTSAAIDRLAMRVAIDKDAIISQALSDYLGHSEWEPHEMAGRLSCSIFRSNDSEVWFCDGVPLVTFYPPSLDSAGTTYTVNVRYGRHATKPSAARAGTNLQSD